MPKQTKTCVYCQGTGVEERVLEGIGMSVCQDCNGEKVVCILCWKPPSECECRENQFDDERINPDIAEPGSSLPPC